MNVRIIRHNFVGDKAKFDEKTCMNPYVDRFLHDIMGCTACTEYNRH